jgi:hypothetical protein
MHRVAIVALAVCGILTGCRREPEMTENAVQALVTANDSAVEAGETDKAGKMLSNDFVVHISVPSQKGSKPNSYTFSRMHFLESLKEKVSDGTKQEIMRLNPKISIDGKKAIARMAEIRTLTKGNDKSIFRYFVEETIEVRNHHLLITRIDANATGLEINGRTQF